MKTLVTTLAAFTLFGAFTTPADAAITFTTNPTEWNAVAGGPSAIKSVDFGTVPAFTFVTEQFSSLGIHFTDGDDIRKTASGPGFGTVPVLVSGPHIFVPPPTTITMTFDAPQFALALSIVEPGQPLEFYLGDVKVGSFTVPLIPLPLYIGLISQQPFDRIEYGVFEDANYALLFNFAFSDVPAPGALGVLAASLILTGRRRRGGQ